MRKGISRAALAALFLCLAAGCSRKDEGTVNMETQEEMPESPASEDAYSVPSNKGTDGGNGYGDEKEKDAEGIKDQPESIQEGPGYSTDQDPGPADIPMTIPETAPAEGTYDETGGIAAGDYFVTGYYDSSVFITFTEATLTYTSIADDLTIYIYSGDGARTIKGASGGTAEIEDIPKDEFVFDDDYADAVKKVLDCRVSVSEDGAFTLDIGNGMVYEGTIDGSGTVSTVTFGNGTLITLLNKNGTLSFDYLGMHFDVSNDESQVSHWALYLR